LPGVDTSSLTPREKREWEGYVANLLAPCVEHSVSLAQCIEEKRDCAACTPAAELVAEQVRRGQPRTHVEGAFRTRFAPDTVREVPIDGSPTKGPADAPVTIVEFADFTCGVCAATAPLIDRVQRSFPDHVRVAFKTYPLSSHHGSEDAARAAIAAGAQNEFWRMHDLMFVNPALIHSNTGILQLAAELGLDREKFLADWESETTTNAIQRDLALGDAVGLTGTPMVFVNGRHVDLEYFSLFDDLQNWVRVEVFLTTGQWVEPVDLPDTEAWPLWAAQAAPTPAASPDHPQTPAPEELPPP
jgi:protein-disulfide isomerase